MDESPDQLRRRAARYRDLADHVNDRHSKADLAVLADEYDALAAQLETAGIPPLQGN
jgi:hypothetical protein